MWIASLSIVYITKHFNLLYFLLFGSVKLVTTLSQWLWKHLYWWDIKPMSYYTAVYLDSRLLVPLNMYMKLPGRLSRAFFVFLISMLTVFIAVSLHLFWEDSELLNWKPWFSVYSASHSLKIWVVALNFFKNLLGNLYSATMKILSPSLSPRGSHTKIMFALSCRGLKPQ